MKNIFIAALLFCAPLLGISQDPIAFKNSKGLWGYKDKLGKIIIEPTYYSKPDPFFNGRVVLKKNFMACGVMDNNGKEILPFKYKSISNFVNGFATVTLEVPDTLPQQKKAAANTTGKIFVRGIVDINGKEIVPVKYKYIDGEFENGWFVIAKDHLDKKTFYDIQGNVFIPPTDLYLLTQKVDGKKYIAIKGGKWGLIDRSFKEILPFVYDNISINNNGLITLIKDGLSGIMDMKLKWVIEPKYKGIQSFINGYACFANEEGLYGIINSKGKITVTPQFGTIYRIDKEPTNVALFSNKGYDASGMFDITNGKILAPNKYYFTPFDYSKGLILFRKDNKRGLMDSTGKILFHGEYEDFSPGFSPEGLAWIKKDGRYGFMNMKGQVVIPAQYETVGGFVEGLAKVKSAGKYGFIDPTGKVVIPLVYIDAYNFEEGMTLVKDESGKYFYINKKGERIQ